MPTQKLTERQSKKWLVMKYENLDNEVLYFDRTK